MNEKGTDKEIGEKSKRLLNAIGGIEDGFIDEAANHEDKVIVEYGEPTTVFSGFKTAIPAKLAAWAACACAVILAVLIFAQKIPFKPAEPAELVFPEITLSDFDDYFELEKMDWDNGAVLSGYSLTEGSRYYYLYADDEMSDKDSINYFISVYDRETGEDRELLSVVCAKNGRGPDLLYVYDNFLYYLLHELYTDGEGNWNRSGYLHRLDLTDGSEEVVLAFGKDVDVYPIDYKFLQIGNCLYFNADSRWARGIYCYNMEEKNIFLFGENAQDPELYKDGIMYYRDKAVYYVKDPNESVKRTENTLDGTAVYCIEGEKKLFDTDTESEDYSLFFDGKQIYFLGSKVIDNDPDDLGNWIDVYGCNFGVYGKKGKLKPIARLELIFDQFAECGELFLVGGYVIYDPENNIFAEFPKVEDDTKRLAPHTNTIVMGDDIVRVVWYDTEDFEVYRVVRK